VADAAVRQRFLTEARGVAKLSHPHIARLYDFGEMDRVLHYAMEYCGGGSLADYVAKNGPVSLRRTIEIAQQIAGALKCAHTAGFIHRDLKPSNIMLTAPDGPPFAKLIDFGLVQPSVPGATRSFGDDQSADGARFLGTPLFASPEQLREEPMDVRTDLFSLGVTLWFLMAGGAPESGSSAEIAASRLNRESYAARLPANLPPPFRDVLARLLEKDRKNRFATAADVFKALNACAAALGFRRARDYTDPAAALEWEDAEATESGALDFTKLEPAELEPVVHRVPGHSSAGFT
jgi:serine/threonine protein kinase